MALRRVYDDTRTETTCPQCDAPVTVITRTDTGDPQAFDGAPTFVETIRIDGRLVGVVNTDVWPTHRCER